MKKKLNSAEAASDQQEAADYVVGQVSGSLFQKKKKKKKKKKKEEEEESAAAGSSLSSLFSAAAAAPTASLLFQPAPKLQVQRNMEEKQQDETPEVKGQTGQKTKTTKVKTAGEEKLENRESALQEADDDERGQETKTKAAKRKRKASEAGGVEKEAEHWVMKRQRLKASKEEEALKRKRTVFVGNLPVSCTKKTLRSLFRDKGSIESIRFRSVVREDPTMSRKVAAIQRKIHPKKQSVNAYVVFKDEEGVAKALERNGLEIEKDFHIRVDRVTDGSGQQQHDHKRSVFVGNLSFEISDLAFRRHFEDCGPVEAVRLVRDRDSGLGKGFGYVLFEGADSVQLALKLDGSKLEGRSVRVKRSVKKEKEKKNKANNSSSSKNTGTTARAGRKGPAKGPAKRGGFKSPKRFTGNQPRSPKSSGSFKGEMVDPTKKTKKKLKKKVKPKKKSLHI